VLSPAPQYRCKNLARARRLAADATFDGVALVEVLTDGALAPRPSVSTDIDLRGRVLLLHLAQPVDETGPDLLVQGGVRLTNLPAAWSAAASTLLSTNAAAVPDANERAQVQSQLLPLVATRPSLDHILVVRLQSLVFNGIDFLEVLDAQLPETSDLRQRILLVHLFLPVPAGITGRRTKDVLIAGGVRVVNPQVSWAVSADELVNGDVSAVVPPADLAEVQAQVVPLLPTDRDTLAHILVVEPEVSGDFSPYELSIVAGDSQNDGFNDPFFGFDSQLSRVTFSFKVDCPSDFDCLPDDTCPPVSAQGPVIDYLAKDYASFRTLMLDRMSQTIPDWKERSPADVGVMLVEVLAFAADQLSYFQDSVANEAYLGTARLRPSLRRHARLLDYRLNEGTNARAFVHLDVTAASSADGAVLPAHTPLVSKTAGLAAARISAADLDSAILAGSQVFETMAPITLHAAHNQIALYTWGDDDCCLPKGATRATLVDDGTLVLQGDDDSDGPIKVGALLAFVEVNSPAASSVGNSNLGAPPDPKHRQVVRLTSVRRSSDPLNGVALVEIAWASDDALPFPLCLTTLNSGAPVSVAQGNIVLADHGHSVTQDLPPLSSARGNQRYLPKLVDGPITFQAQVQDADGNLLLFDPGAPAAVALAGDARLARPDVVLFPIPSPDDAHLRGCDRDLTADTDHWTAVADLLESGPFSQEFVVEMEDDGTAQLRFGDGTLGALPAPALFACYRIGNGAAGNLGADGLGHVVAPFAGIARVANLLPAAGGTDPEPAQEIRLNAPQAFRTQERAVTEADWSDVTQRHPGIQRAVASRRFTGSWYTMFVAVDRLGGLAVDDPFKAELAAFLERFRLAGYDLEIEGAIAVPLEIRLTVCTLPGFFRADVKKALLDALSNRNLPGGRRGFFHPDNFTFGQPVFLSQLLAAALAVPGVASIDTSEDHLVFKRLGQVAGTDSADGLLRMERLEIARLDNDPSQPEHGTLDLVLQGGA
jgi:hypothetical protein